MQVAPLLKFQPEVDRFGRSLQVGFGEDNHGIATAQLHDGRGQAFRSLGHHPSTGRSRSGQHDQIDPFVDRRRCILGRRAKLTQRCARHACLVKGVDQSFADRFATGRGFEQDSIAGHQCLGDLHAPASRIG